MVGRELLRQARAAGLTVWAEGDRVRARGPRRLEPLVYQLIDRQAEVLAALASENAFTREVLETFDGELVDSDEPGSTVPFFIADPTVPVRACNGCKGRGFHKVRGGPEWVCDRCHPGPGPGPERWTERVQATEPSIFESMHRREAATERMDIRGLGKKGRRPTSWDGGQS